VRQLGVETYGSSNARRVAVGAWPVGVFMLPIGPSMCPPGIV
jgi:hypothetical protein